MELQAIKWAVEELLPLMRYHQVHIYTDHKPLADKMTGLGMDKTFAGHSTDQPEIYAVWHYVRGAANTIAYSLSRHEGINRSTGSTG